MFADAFAFAHGAAKEAGKYPHLIRIYAPPASTPVDGFGHPSGSPSLWADDVPAAVVPRSAMSPALRQKVAPEISHVVYLDHMEGLTADLAVEHDGRLLHVAGVINVGEMSFEHELHCTERA